MIEHNIIFGNYLHDASAVTTRADWYTGPGPLPDAIAEKIQKQFNVGWWTFHLGLFGYGRIVEENMKIVAAALEPQPWHKGEPVEPFGPGAGVPFVLPLNVVNWMGGRGGHIGFSPVMPPSGELALAAFRRNKVRFEAAGLDYYTSFTMGHRHICNVNMIIFDRDNAEMVARTKAMFAQLIKDARDAGYGEYRTHLDYMDPVAQSYDYNGHAMLRINEKVKDVLDPSGILAPGKNGIWPARLRQGTRA